MVGSRQDMWQKTQPRGLRHDNGMEDNNNKKRQFRRNGLIVSDLMMLSLAVSLSLSRYICIIVRAKQKKTRNASVISNSLRQPYWHHGVHRQPREGAQGVGCCREGMRRSPLGDRLQLRGRGLMSEGLRQARLRVPGGDSSARVLEARDAHQFVSRPRQASPLPLGNQGLFRRTRKSPAGGVEEE